MSCSGGLLDVRDRVASALEAKADPDADVTLHTDYAPDWLDVDSWAGNAKLLNKFVGRHLYVFPAGKSQAATASRKLDLNEYRIEVVVIERYGGSRKVPPEEWTAERIAWVESQVYDYLGDARQDPYPVRDCFPQSLEWSSPYSYDLLREMKLFRSGLVVNLRRLDY